MESIGNYSSEDEPEIMENCTKKRDDSSKSRDGRDTRRGDDWPMSGHHQSEGKRAKKDDTNYESVQMDMSEDSEETSSRDGRDVPSPKRKSRSRERRQSRSAENERETTRYKSSKDHHRSSRDYRDKDRDRGRKRDKDRDRRHRDRHSDRKRESRRDRERERHRRRSSSRERRRRSSSRESRRDRRRSKSRSRSHGRSRRTPEMKNNTPTATTPLAAAVAAAAALSVTPSVPPPVALPSSPTLIPTVSLPVNEEARIERFDWRTQQRVQQLEKMGIDLKRTQETAAIELPNYYNPGVVNPSRYAEQMQKRKLLWSHKKSDNVEQAAAAKWESAKFSQDQDGKVQSKFMRLMGIKEPPKSSGDGTSGSGVDLVKKQEELFSTMEQQYEVARQVTHTMRGVGFGFTSQRPF